MPPLRVVHVSPYAPQAWAYGGIPRVVGAQTAGLRERGVAVTLVSTDAFDAAARLPASAVERGIEHLVFPNRSNSLAYHAQFFTPRGLRAWLDAHAADFDLAHLHGCHHLPGALAARAFGRAGKPYVLQPNGTAPRIERRRLLKHIFDLTLGRGVLEGAARIVAVSAAESRQLAALNVGPSRLALIPNPIDAGEFSAPIPRGGWRDRLAVGARPLVLFLGRVTPRKRVDLLIDAFARLDAPEARLVIAGNDGGALADARRQARRAQLDGRIAFPGLLSGAERLAALADADVVVYPSQDEVFGLVAAEALLAGTPVVVSDDSGCGELVRGLGGGLLHRAGDPADLARAITDALARADALRAEIPAARQRLLRDYSADAVAASLDALYRDVAR